MIGHQRNMIERIVLFALAVIANCFCSACAIAQIRAGSAAVDITPIQLPVIVNGGFTERQMDQIGDPLLARCLVVTDGRTDIAIVVADSCMIPRDVCDRIKSIAEQSTGINSSHMLIAATHTHSAPSLMNFCLGSRRDEPYTELFVKKVAEVISRAHQRLLPAEVGWTSTRAPNHTYCRRWIRHPDRPDTDPFGDPTVWAMMHPGYQNQDYLGPAGPVDDQLGMVAFRTTDGDPIALLANFSMHYVGGTGGISADYWGHFDRIMQEKIAQSDPDRDTPYGFIPMMSQGTSGDLWLGDYSRPADATRTNPAKFAQEIADIAFAAFQTIEYQRDLTLAIEQAIMTFPRRVPDEKRLKWARQLNEQRGDRLPGNRPEVYAQQAVWIAENPREEIVLQAIRIGDVGIAAMPHEVFAVTGLSIKAQSPLPLTMNIELANGAAGYIPPPEQHALGGYTTWPARTAGLAVDAEPKIVNRLIEMLENISGQPRRPLTVDLYPPSIRADIDRVLGK